MVESKAVRSVLVPGGSAPAHLPFQGTSHGGPRALLSLADEALTGCLEWYGHSYTFGCLSLTLFVLSGPRFCVKPAPLLSLPT